MLNRIRNFFVCIIVLFSFVSAFADINVINHVVDSEGNNYGLYVACGTNPSGWDTPWVGPLDNDGDIGACAAGKFKYAFISYCNISIDSFCGNELRVFYQPNVTMNGINIIVFPILQFSKQDISYRIQYAGGAITKDRLPVKISPVPTQ